MSKAVLSLGSNMGEKNFYLKEALKILENVHNIEIERVSSFYETKPFGTSENQENYLNCCVEISTNLNPFTLLGVCLGIESSLGRKRPYRFSPRTIDIDIIFYENEKIHTKDLILPHPRMHERAFVLVPMSELFPEGKFKNFKFNTFLDFCDKTDIIKL